MAGVLHEVYGFRPDDHSPEAVQSAADRHCPFLQSDCQKRGGACSVTPLRSQEHIVVCPFRMYSARHRFLSELAIGAFAEHPLELDPDGWPILHRGSQARQHAIANQVYAVGVFGKGFDPELRLPPAIDGGAAYSVDFVVVLISPDGELVAFSPVEVQTIDTTGSYAPSLAAFENDRAVESSNFGMNWENVNKRILPQLIFKGLLLQGERHCKTGLYFVTSESVYDKIMLRLGGPNRLRRIPKQPSSITFWRYTYGDEAQTQHGTPLSLVRLDEVTVSVSDLSIAFITPENLPAAGAFENSIVGRL